MCQKSSIRLTDSFREKRCSVCAFSLWTTIQFINIIKNISDFYHINDIMIQYRQTSRDLMGSHPCEQPITTFFMWSNGFFIGKKWDLLKNVSEPHMIEGFCKSKIHIVDFLFFSVGDKSKFNNKFIQKSCIQPHSLFSYIKWGLELWFLLTLSLMLNVESVLFTCLCKIIILFTLCKSQMKCAFCIYVQKNWNGTNWTNWQKKCSHVL